MKMNNEMRMFLAAVCVVCIMMYLQVHLDYRNVDRFGVSLCACSRCIAEVREEPWFMARFDSRVPVLLSTRNSRISNMTRHWWTKLQGYRGKKNFSTVVDSLFSLFPDMDHYADSGPNRCRTCAVVGNSANLLGSHYGPMIDTHDFIIRMNHAPTKAFEKDVGSRTTHRAIYPESAVDVDNSTHLILLPFKILDMEWLVSAFTTKNITRTYTRVKRSVQANKDKVMILSPDFIRYIYEIWLRKKGKYPTTGFLMLMFALHVCDQVSVFGFGASENGNWGHYFDKSYRANLNRGVHQGSNEQNIIVELVMKKKIKIYRGW